MQESLRPGVPRDREQFKRGTYLDKDGYLIEVYVRETQHGRLVDRRRTYEPTGRLAFNIGDVYVPRGGGSGSREIVWRDGLRLKLALLESERLRAEHTLAEAEKARLARETREQEEAEKARFDLLVRQVEGWELSHRIQAFVDAAEQCYLTLHGRIEACSEADEWIRWARGQAEWIDPLRELRAAVSPPA